MTRRGFAAVLSATMVVLGVALWAQDAAPRVISGRVVEAGTGVPVAFARITGGTSTSTPADLADIDGRFSVRLLAGQQSVAASKTGYVRQVVSVADSRPLEIRLPRAASISGRIVDPSGDPLAGFWVRASLRTSGGSGAVVAETYTDDRGEYRVGGLPVGLFTVTCTDRGPQIALPAQIRLEGNDPSTAMLASVADSALASPFVANPIVPQTIDLRMGEDRYGVDFALTASATQLDFVIRPGNLTPGIVTVEPQTRVSRPAVAPSSFVRGQVIDESDRQVPGAHVRIAVITAHDDISTTVGYWTTQADASGWFEFSGLPSGIHALAAWRNDYVAARSAVFEMDDGARREGVQIRLGARLGAIEGRVLDERGEPLQNATVRPLTLGYEAGRVGLDTVPGVAMARSDDRGRFRLHSVPPGRYIVSASMGDSPSAEWPGYVNGYHPGTHEAALARPVRVAAGSELNGVDIALPRVRPVRISGTLLDANGDQRAGGRVQLVARGIGGAAVPARMQTVRDFEFLGMPPGQYVMQVSLGAANDWTEEEFGVYSVTLEDADIEHVPLRTMASSRIAGRITFASDRAGRPARDRVGIVAVPVDPLFAPAKLATARIGADWTFELAGITGARRLQALRLPDGWAVDGVRVRGEDVTDRPLDFGGSDRSLTDVEVVLTDRVSVTGTVVGDRSQPLSRASVIVYSTDPGHWYYGSRFLRKATTDSRGAFAIGGLPSGSYHAVAVPAGPAPDPPGTFTIDRLSMPPNTAATLIVPSISTDAWQDPAFLEALAPRALRLSVSQGPASTIRVQVTAP